METRNRLNDNAHITFSVYMSTNEGRSDLGLHPPNRDPFNVLPISNIP